MRSEQLCVCSHTKEQHRPSPNPVAMVRNTICHGDAGKCICREGFRPGDLERRYFSSGGFPSYGHEYKVSITSISVKPEGRFEKRGKELGELVEEKNAAYGDAGRIVAECMKAIYPNGIPVHKTADALYTIRVLDKLCRIANRKDAFGENPWEDIAGYAILVSANEDRAEEEARLAERERSQVAAK